MKRKSSRQKIKEDLYSGDPLVYYDMPQKLLTLLATNISRNGNGVYSKPSEAMSDWKYGANGLTKTVADLIIDPLNVIPYGKLKYVKSSGMLDSTLPAGYHLINPGVDAANKFRKTLEMSDSIGDTYEIMKVKQNKQIPAYSFGLDGGVLGGLASGASAGAALGPWGAVAGAGLGLVSGLVGSRKRKKAEEKARTRQMHQSWSDQGFGMQAELESDYYQDNGMAYTFANGGFAPTNMAYVDDGEVLRDMNGNLSQVPDMSTGSDQYLIDASPLESVLSNKLKRPGTKQTFAEVMDKHINKPKAAEKLDDRFAQGRKQAEELTNNMMYNKLLMEQEAVKQKKGIKPKSKGVPAYEDGILNKRIGDMDFSKVVDWFKGANTFMKNLHDAPMNIGANAGEILRKAVMYDGIQRGPNAPLFSQNTFGGNSLGQLDSLGNRVGEQHNTTKATPQSVNQLASGRLYGLPQISPTTGSIAYDTYANPGNSIDGITSAAPVLPKTPVTTTQQPGTVVPPQTRSTSTPVTQNTAQPAGRVRSQYTIDDNGRLTTDYAKANRLKGKKGYVDVPAAATPTITAKDVQAAHDYRARNPITPSASEPNIAGGIMNGIGAAASLIPTIYNLFQGPAEYESKVSNPYSGSARRAMAQRRMNINPMLQANRTNRAISNYNASNLNANSGANLALRTQLAAQEARDTENLYALQQNTNNQYLGEYANMLNNLGQQDVQQTVYNNDINARNRAAARNYTGTAMSQLGQWAQTQQQMYNQRSRDEMMWPMMKQFLAQGYSAPTVQQVEQKYRKV